MDAEVKQVFVKSSKMTPEAAPKKITKSRRVLPKAKPAAPPPRKTTAKAHRTYPMGVLKGTRQTRKAKLEPTNNPSKSPPFRRGTLRVLTPKGERDQEQRATEATSGLSVDQMRSQLAKSGHPLGPRAPPELVKQIHAAANMGGFLK
jgi:hypothetical protein